MLQNSLQFKIYNLSIIVIGTGKTTVQCLQQVTSLRISG